MKFWVDAWDPSYASGADYGGAGEGGGPQRDSTAALDADVEVPAAAWAPVPAPPDLLPPEVVLLVDGVRRTDARLWTDEGGGGSYPGLAVSYAAGVVRCDLARGEAVLAGQPAVERGLFTGSPTAGDIDCGPIRYRAHRVDTAEIPKLAGAAQGPLTKLEVRVAAAVRDQAEDSVGQDLLVVDGPLRGRTDLPRAIGYVKTHQSSYLPPALTAVVTALAPAQRCPIFRLGTSWGCYTWYVRLPGGNGAPWSGLVRVECGAQLSVQAAVALADLSVVTLPRFAATSYKDPRAPQNLIPIAGLEQRLRGRLGDARLLHRALTRAAATPRPIG